MKGQQRNIYPGGNTSEGFYSYYNYILPQREAEKIFCIKGGPGVGKSTMMKEIGVHFLEKGEDVDFLWCSSDPSSLDGILLKKRAIAMVDGTAPHIVDPKNPGAVDEIVNLGEFWDEAAMGENREGIISCNEKIGETFEITYGYLKCAGSQYRFMADILEKLISQETMQNIRRQLNVAIGKLSPVKRMENKIRRDYAMGTDTKPGKVKKFFAGAITPEGIKCELDSLVRSMEKVIVLNVPVGFRTERMLKSESERLTGAGFDVEEYYCPMDPQHKLEHILVPSIGLAVVSCNSYHGIYLLAKNKKTTTIEVLVDHSVNQGLAAVLEDLQQESRKNIDKALTHLKMAKEYHDLLEEYYVPNMDFEEIERKRNEIIDQIEKKILS